MGSSVAQALANSRWSLPSIDESPSLTPNLIDLNCPILSSSSNFCTHGSPSTKIKLPHYKHIREEGTPKNISGAYSGPHLELQELEEIVGNRRPNYEEDYLSVPPGFQPKLHCLEQQVPKEDLNCPILSSSSNFCTNGSPSTKIKLPHYKHIKKEGTPINISGAYSGPHLDLQALEEVGGNRRPNYEEDYLLVPPGFQPKLHCLEQQVPREDLEIQEADFLVEMIDPWVPPTEFKCLFCTDVYLKQQSLAAHYNKHRKHPLRYELLKYPRKPKPVLSSGSGLAQPQTRPITIPFGAIKQEAQPLRRVAVPWWHHKMVAPPHLRRSWDPVLTHRPLDPSYVPTVTYERVYFG